MTDDTSTAKRKKMRHKVIELYPNNSLRHELRLRGHSDESIDRFLTDITSAGYGVAPFNPTNQMLIASIMTTQPPQTVDSVLRSAAKATKRWRAMLTAGTTMAMSRRSRTENDEKPMPVENESQKR